MALSDSLLKTVNSLLTKFDATDRVVYKRLITSTGGDALIGRPGTVSTLDTVLSPQPAVRVVTGRDVALALSGTSMLQIGDYVLTVSASSITRAELQERGFALVFKSGTAEEELMVMSYDPAAVNGTDVAFDIVARSKKR